MAKFKLVKGAGPHKVGPLVFTQGQIVEHDGDLVKHFPGKFERLSPPEKDAVEKPSETFTPYDTPETVKSVPEVSHAGQDLDVDTDDEPLEGESPTTTSNRAARRREQQSKPFKFGHKH